jgi:ribonuclease D
MRLITTTSDLADTCARLARHPFVTVDTEFMRETTFWPKLCLVQMAGPDEEVIVDPLARGLDLAPFYQLMANDGIEKVFHAARQDIEIVFVQAGLLPRPIFDTQVAAMVCGFGESVSYVNLVKRLTGRDLDKSSRFTDWSRRPLSEAQLHYALADVTHLRDVFAKLRDHLSRTGRASWVAQEMAELLDPATYETKPEDAWRRLKGRPRSRKNLAVLIELAAWRERVARSQDVPRNRVLRDEALQDVAAQMPTELEKLSELRSLSDGFARSARAKEIVDAVKRGLERDPASLPRLEEGGSGPSRDTSATVDLLKVLLKAAAERHGVAPRLIAGSEELELLARDPKARVKALQGWRRELFGEDAIAIAEGRMALAVRQGSVVKLPVAVRENRASAPSGPAGGSGGMERRSHEQQAGA